MSSTVQRMWTAVTCALWLGLSSPAVAQPQGMDKTDSTFLKTAAARQQAEITLSQLAAERSESESIKHFAQRMVADHTKASQEVNNLVSLLGTTLPEAKTKGPRGDMGKLFSLSGPAFDRAYITHELADHQKNVWDFAAKSKALKNPQVRAWASATLPVLKEHLSLAKGLAKTVEKGGGKKRRTQG